MGSSIHEKLNAMREKHDIDLPRPPNLRETVQKGDGTEVPLTPSRGPLHQEPSVDRCPLRSPARGEGGVVRPGAAGGRGGVMLGVRDEVSATGWRGVVTSSQEEKGAWMGHRSR